MKQVRAKLRVAEVKELRSFKVGDPSDNPDLYTGDKYGERIKLEAVIGGSGDCSTENAENNQYAKYTPFYRQELQVDNPVCWGFYKPGAEYYNDTIPVLEVTV